MPTTGFHADNNGAMTRGRFAPSPTGLLHMGNLRTAMAAWCSARSVGGDFILRFEDLDRVTSRREWAEVQRTDLAALGIESAEEPVFQSERFDLYNDAISTLREKGLVYECFCTRKDIADAAAAPHGNAGVYPGTCRTLTQIERAQRAETRRPALRIRSESMSIEFVDTMCGRVQGVADDVVIRRNDGVPSYNIAVVIDDAIQGITEVVRGDDLVDVTPSQILLQRLLKLPTPTYAHVPLVVGADGERLAKRHGAVTLADMATRGATAEHIRTALCASLSCTGPTDFSWAKVSPAEWVFPGEFRGNIEQ